MLPERVRQRFLQDPLALRLGGLAADLARLADCVEDPRDQAALLSLFEEGKWFAEWAAPHAPLDVQATLADVQIFLARWHRRWLTGSTDTAMQAEAKSWSDRLLQLSGLLSSR